MATWTNAALSGAQRHSGFLAFSCERTAFGIRQLRRTLPMQQSLRRDFISKCASQHRFLLCGRIPAQPV